MVDDSTVNDSPSIVGRQEEGSQAKTAREERSDGRTNGNQFSRRTRRRRRDRGGTPARTPANPNCISTDRGKRSTRDGPSCRRTMCDWEEMVRRTKEEQTRSIVNLNEICTSRSDA